MLVHLSTDSTAGAIAALAQANPAAAFAATVILTAAFATWATRNLF